MSDTSNANGGKGKKVIIGCVVGFLLGFLLFVELYVCARYDIPLNLVYKGVMSDPASAFRKELSVIIIMSTVICGFIGFLRAKAAQSISGGMQWADASIKALQDVLAFFEEFGIDGGKELKRSYAILADDDKAGHYDFNECMQVVGKIIKACKSGIRDEKTYRTFASELKPYLEQFAGLENMYAKLQSQQWADIVDKVYNSEQKKTLEIRNRKKSIRAIIIGGIIGFLLYYFILGIYDCLRNDDSLNFWIQGIVDPLTWVQPIGILIGVLAGFSSSLRKRKTIEEYKISSKSSKVLRRIVGGIIGFLPAYFLCRICIYLRYDFYSPLLFWRGLLIPWPWVRLIAVLIGVEVGFWVSDNSSSSLQKMDQCPN